MKQKCNFFHILTLYYSKFFITAKCLETKMVVVEFTLHSYRRILKWTLLGFISLNVFFKLKFINPMYNYLRCKEIHNSRNIKCRIFRTEMWKMLTLQYMLCYVHLVLDMNQCGNIGTMSAPMYFRFSPCPSCTLSIFLPIPFPSLPVLLIRLYSSLLLLPYYSTTLQTLHMCSSS